MAAIFSTLVFALIPALQLTRPNISESLQSGSRGAVSTESIICAVPGRCSGRAFAAAPGRRWLANQNVRQSSRDQTRVRPVPAAVVQLILPKAKYPEPEKHRQFFDQILPKLAALPGVEAAGGAFPMPFSGNDAWIGIFHCRSAATSGWTGTGGIASDHHLGLFSCDAHAGPARACV